MSERKERPFNTAEAKQLFCNDKEESRDGNCDPDCQAFCNVIGSTCSTRCKFCNERNWFTGGWGDDSVPKRFKCIACGKVIGRFHNSFMKGGT